MVLFRKTASLAIVAAIALATSVDAQKKAAEEAKWLVSESNWGYATSTNIFDPDAPDRTDTMASVLSYGMNEQDGRLYFYLTGSSSTEAAAVATALTLSEAALYPKNYRGGTCGDDGTTDPEDPRCAKLTISGTVAPCATEECTATGKKALFSKHPQMEQWSDAGYQVYEMTMTDLWMIYSYGGGSILTPEQYTKAEPKHHSFPTFSHNLRGKTQQRLVVKINDNDDFPMPDKSDLVARARWIVAHSLWTTVSTTSVRLDGHPWGNIRSMADGPVPLESTGLPFFYLPTPDPTAVDVRANDQIILSFSEASLSERVLTTDNNHHRACSGLDAMDPLCARIHLYGTATKISKTDNRKAMQSLGKRHPLAPWLAKGGAHTGGDYYTITLSGMVLLDNNVGGAVDVPVEDYLSFSPTNNTIIAVEVDAETI